MKHKHRMILPLAMIASLTLASSASAALTVVNGNFQNTTGLTAMGADWYSGVPTGWTSSSVTNTYTVGGPATSLLNLTSLVANIEQLSAGPSAPFYQNIGTTDVRSSITLTFDFLLPWYGGLPANLGAEIWDATNSAVLAGSSSIATTGAKTITAQDVAAGTNIHIRFWKVSDSGYPAIDNVSISTTPVPEPSAALLGGLGMLALLRRRR